VGQHNESHVLELNLVCSVYCGT